MTKYRKIEVTNKIDTSIDDKLIYYVHSDEVRVSHVLSHVVWWKKKNVHSGTHTPPGRHYAISALTFFFNLTVNQ